MVALLAYLVQIQSRRRVSSPFPAVLSIPTRKRQNTNITYATTASLSNTHVNSLVTNHPKRIRYCSQAKGVPLRYLI